MKTLTFKKFSVIKKPWYWSLSPVHRKCGGAISFGKIVLRKDFFSDYATGNPSPITIGLLIHETEHLKRQKLIGFWRYVIQYNLSPRFRINEEFEADKARIRYLKKNGVEWDLDARARMLSSYQYWWAISYKEAKRILEKMWRIG